ncbi:hypothetical protein KIPB_013251 [Kipferlia bialata]|uniref:Uncharacterized protein n=1 Tax=Kipferlia bialata TaxID=797122 RepID=A0A9K3GQ03_9EUKA|nr:hypothetical protein KIPB_013251 [Kipferlia bialata]|eukprot:g13251.t1
MFGADAGSFDLAEVEASIQRCETFLSTEQEGPTDAFGASSVYEIPPGRSVSPIADLPRRSVSPQLYRGRDAEWAETEPEREGRATLEERDSEERAQHHAPEYGTRHVERRSVAPSRERPSRERPLKGRAPSPGPRRGPKPSKGKAPVDRTAKQPVRAQRTPRASAGRPRQSTDRPMSARMSMLSRPRTYNHCVDAKRS